MIVTLSNGRIMPDLERCPSLYEYSSRISPLSPRKIPKQSLLPRGRGGEGDTLDIINRMRGHVSDNRMILNSPSLYFF